MLLVRSLFVHGKHLLDLLEKGTKHWPGPSRALTVTGRNRFLRHLLNCAPVQAEFATNLADALAFNQNRSTSHFIHLHSVHLEGTNHTVRPKSRLCTFRPANNRRPFCIFGAASLAKT